MMSDNEGGEAQVMEDADVSEGDAVVTINESPAAASGWTDAPPPPLAPLLIKGGGFALVVAFGCAFAWAKIAEFSGYEIGYLALGVGWAVGFAFMIGSNGSAGMPGVIVAVLLAVLSVVLGKFYTSALLNPDAEFGMMTYLTEIYPEHLADPMDALWLGLAGYAAMKITSKSAAR
jgi:hypothetical protein